MRCRLALLRGHTMAYQVISNEEKLKFQNSKIRHSYHPTNITNITIIFYITPLGFLIVILMCRPQQSINLTSAKTNESNGHIRRILGFQKLKAEHLHPPTIALFYCSLCYSFSPSSLSNSLLKD